MLYKISNTNYYFCITCLYTNQQTKTVILLSNKMLKPMETHGPFTMKHDNLCVIEFCGARFLESDPVMPRNLLPRPDQN